MKDDKFTENRLELEKVLVRQFRLLQEMHALSKKERDSLLNEPDFILKIVEDKEALLDRMSVMEDNCRKIVQEFSLVLDLHSEDTSIEALLPHFQPEDTSRIRNLSEGISSLASQVRELNRANQALALSKLEWLKATQAFLISIFQPESDGYSAQKFGNKHREATGLGVEYRV
jgi:flagellar biosynthesis/type III secretory pathway chaperone